MEKKLVQYPRKISHRKDEFAKNAWLHEQYVCDIDEVGRGCLAVPVLIAAVILPLNKTSRLLIELKIFTSGKRLISAQWIYQCCLMLLELWIIVPLRVTNYEMLPLLSLKKALNPVEKQDQQIFL